MLSSPDGSRSGGAKRTPVNPKFAHVKSTLNTGANAGNVKPKGKGRGHSGGEGEKRGAAEHT
jgi:hypothetical protein